MTAMDLQSERLKLHEAKVGDLPRLREIIQGPGTAEWWGDYEGSSDDDALLEGWSVRLGDVIIGWVGYYEETEAKYPSVALDIMIDAAHHGQGYGPESLRAVIDHFAERGHHRFTIDPNAKNERAIRAYEKTGFKAIGIARQYERLTEGGDWDDGLLMDLIVSDLE